MFKLIKIEYGHGNVPEPILVPAAAGTYKEGDALVVSSNKVAKASGDVNAAYICYAGKTVTSTDSDLLVYKVTPAMLFEAPLSAAVGSTVKFGAKLTIDSTGEKVTATAATTNFGAYVESVNGASVAGDKVIVRLA